jgi:aconitate hydratase
MLRKRVLSANLSVFGPGCTNLSLADRATIVNIAPEYGAAMGYFPIDEQTIDFLKMTGRESHNFAFTEPQLKVGGLFRHTTAPSSIFTTPAQLWSLLSSVKPCLAGPKRPHDRVELASMKSNFNSCLTNLVGFKGYNIAQDKLAPTSKFAYES